MPLPSTSALWATRRIWRAEIAIGTHQMRRMSARHHWEAFAVYRPGPQLGGAWRSGALVGRRLDAPRPCALAAIDFRWLSGARSCADALVQVLVHIPVH
jgi:hypothetical protein